MIREFQQFDLQGFKVNPLSVPQYFNLEEVLAGQHLVRYTMFNRERAVAILLYTEYAQTKYDCAIVLSLDAKLKDLAMCRAYIEEAARKRGATRLQTTSVHNEALARWHKFLGFEFEGLRKKFVGDIDYAMWGRTWG